MKLFCQIFFQNDSTFARGVAPPEKPESELFSYESELCQTGPNTNPLQMLESGGSSSTAGHLVSPFSRAELEHHHKSHSVVSVQSSTERQRQHLSLQISPSCSIRIRCPAAASPLPAIRRRSSTASASLDQTIPSHPESSFTSLGPARRRQDRPEGRAFSSSELRLETSRSWRAVLGRDETSGGLWHRSGEFKRQLAAEGTHPPVLQNTRSTYVPTLMHYSDS